MPHIVPPDEPVSDAVTATQRQEAWRREEAPRSAQVIANEAATSLRRQQDVLQGHDVKASFLTATAGALLAGLAASNHWPSNPHAQDLLATAIAGLVVALLAAVFVWFPRPFHGDPDPRAIGPMFHDYEENVLRELTTKRTEAYAANIKVLEQKAWGLRVGATALSVALVAGVFSLAVH